MADIVLATFNARYAHASFGLRYLMANLGELAVRASLLEFTQDIRTPEAAEAILALKPRIVGIGVYVWNIHESSMLAAELKRLCPALIIVVGGPEVSYEIPEQDICRTADFVITGEGELAFSQLCRRLLSGQAAGSKIIAGPVPDLSVISLPYDMYGTEDIANRVIYTETSRGCPFACEFCLSSLDKGVRYFPLGGLFAAWEKLLSRGARRFKFVDRTFNLDVKRAAAVINFFLERYQAGLFLHFEMVPDLLPEELVRLISKFPQGALQLEMGVQTFNNEVSARVSRSQDSSVTEKNILRLRRETKAHIHADLIIGLPGEDLASFAAGFDRLSALEPQEIQIGILKLLRGAPIARHSLEFGMVYSPCPPYELRQNSLLDFFSMQRLRRFARYWELIANSGIFPETTRLLLCTGSSPFGNFLTFSDWLYSRTGQSHSIARARLRTLLLEYLTGVLKITPGRAAQLTENDALQANIKVKDAGSCRQARHSCRPGFSANTEQQK